jgi:hypothetical protein
MVVRYYWCLQRNYFQRVLSHFMRISVMRYKNINKVSLYAQILKQNCFPPPPPKSTRITYVFQTIRKLVLNCASFELWDIFRKASSHKMRLHCVFSRNFAVERLALSLHSQEFAGSYLGTETGYHAWGSSWSSSVPLGIFQEFIRPTLNWATSFPF